MQVKFYTLKSPRLTGSSFFRIALIMLLTTGFMLLSQQVSAQLMIKIDDIEYFGPPTGSNTDTPFPTASSQHSSSPFTTFNSPSLNISPNPINNQATISKDTGVTLTKLEIIDMSGNMVFTGNFGLGSLYVPYIDPGYYNFRLHTSAGIVNKVMGIN